MNSLVFASLVPVVLLIAVGLMAGRLGWIRATSLKDLSNLIFLLLTPALLFRTMSGVHVQTLDFKPVAAYFLAALALFFGILFFKGLGRRAIVLALASTFSNTVMIGIALIGLLYGPAGQVTLMTLISLHALVLLTLATVLLELSVAREAKHARETKLPAWHALLTVLMAIKSAVLHPVPLPIILGLLFAQTGWVIPEVLDRPLELLANAFGPLALVLVGVTLAFSPIGANWREALGLSMAKNFVLPAFVFGLCLLLGVSGLPMAVMVVAASLPIGANVFLVSQRYEVAQDVVTASVAVSTALAMLSVTLVLLWVG